MRPSVVTESERVNIRKTTQAASIGTAGMQMVVSSPVSGTDESCRRKTMRWCRKTVVFPMRRVCCCGFSPRVHKPRKKGGELVKLHNDVQTCGYEDVQVMWEMLRRSDASSSHPNKCNQKPGPFWKTFLNLSN